MNLSTFNPLPLRVPRHIFQVALGAVVFFALGGLLLTSNASAQGRLPTPIFNAVVSVDRGLQVGIEEAPAVLIRDLDTSSTACGKALEAEQSDGPGQSSWTALSQAVQRGDIPASRAIVAALSESNSDLGQLRALFSGRWHDAFAKKLGLMPGIAQAQKGIDRLTVAVENFGIAFELWEEHDCVGAQKAIAATNRKIPSAVEAVNRGMKRMTAALL